MSHLLFITLFHICSLYAITSSEIPSYIELCSKKDNLSDCILQNARAAVKHLAINGDSDLHIPNIGKFMVPVIDMHATKELKVQLIDLLFTGLDDVQIQTITLKKNILHLRAFIPKLMYNGHYTFEGKLLMLVLAATGNMNVTQVGLTIDYKAKLKTEVRNGEKYYYASDKQPDTITDLEDIKGNIFKFDNLFPDERITTEMNLFLNDNWREVYEEVREILGPSYTVYLINPFVNGILKQIPIGNLYQH